MRFYVRVASTTVVTCSGLTWGTVLLVYVLCRSGRFRTQPQYAVWSERNYDSITVHCCTIWSPYTNVITLILRGCALVYACQRTYVLLGLLVVATLCIY